MKLPMINQTFSRYPSPPNRFGQGVGFLVDAGGFYFYFPGMFYFMIMLVDMVTEK